MLAPIRFEGLEIQFLQTKDDTVGSLDVFEMTVAPKAKMPAPHYHHTWDETLYGIAGVTSVQLDGRNFDLAAGQSLFIKRGIVHGFRNETSLPSKVLAVLTPGVLGPAYFQEMEALLNSETRDVAKMKETMLRHGLIPVPET
ncbi:cupin domain-containing protein [Labrys sp. KB_33_2]|uniref:cupin domain-containing protein n=1 Tax=Labrys sp. KB_33_2 TaxID=3237479 RepID=UPI003F9285A3